LLKLQNVKNQLVPIIKRKLLEEAHALHDAILLPRIETASSAIESSGNEVKYSGYQVGSFVEGAGEVKSSGEEAESVSLNDVDSVTLNEAGSATPESVTLNEVGSVTLNVADENEVASVQDEPSVYESAWPQAPERVDFFHLAAKCLA
jgi:hypothetical protein